MKILQLIEYATIQNNENNNPNGSVDIVNKRQIIHPKLKRKRPTPQKAHLPSINLKAIITPATDAPNPAALGKMSGSF